MRTFFNNRKTILSIVITIQLFILVPTVFKMLVTASPITPTATNVGGDMTQDTTWTAAGSPYVITQPLSVAQGVTLTIESGVEVRGQDTMWIGLDGHLEAVGTAVNPIIFTSDNNVVGGWGGIFVEDDGSALINHVVIEKGYTNLFIRGGLGGTVQLQNSLLNQSGMHPITVFRASALHRLQMSNVTFTNNNVDRILIDTDWPNFADNWEFELYDNVQLTAQPGLRGYEIPQISLVVPEGVTLTIDPGVTVMANEKGYAVIVIEEGAHLKAIGSANDPIVFTSVADSGSGEWTSVVIEGVAHIQHAHFRNSQFNLDIYKSSGDPIVLKDILLSDSSITGMLIAIDALHRVEMSNVTFTDNAQNRVRLMHYYEDDQLAGNLALKSMPGLEGYEYFLDEDTLSPILKVPQGITLTLEAGSTLIMPKSSDLKVFGDLQALGKADQPVIITVTTVLQPESWGGILLDATGRGVFNYAEIRYAETAVSLLTPTSTLTVTNSMFTQNTIGIYANYGTVTAVCTTFNQNTLGFLLDPDATASVNVHQSIFSGNTIAGIDNQSTSKVAAENNWWGVADGPSGDGPGSGDAVFGVVQYTPWQTAPDCDLGTQYEVFLPFVIRP
ncbi:MAG: hypothetical protein GY943_29410 [Chloroflexi bacterium]|nr:hypothetical protein [Chloroflexota bacterium]